MITKTRVYEPCETLEIKIPEDALSVVTKYLPELSFDLNSTQSLDSGYWLITGNLPTIKVPEITKALPGITHGEGTILPYSATDRVFVEFLPFDLIPKGKLTNFSCQGFIAHSFTI